LFDEPAESVTASKGQKSLAGNVGRQVLKTNDIIGLDIFHTDRSVTIGMFASKWFGPAGPETAGPQADCVFSINSAGSQSLLSDQLNRARIPTARMLTTIKIMSFMRFC
jgi:hypothetical protein